MNPISMNQLHEQFLSSDLVLPSCREAAKKVIEEDETPLSTLIARGYVQSESFYSRLAHILQVHYLASISIPINGEGSIVHSLPLSQLIHYQLYFFEHDHQLFVVLCDPFIPQYVLDDVLRFTSYTEYQIMITSPQEIHRVLNSIVHRSVSSETAETIHVLHPTYSTETYTTLLVPKLFPIGTIILYCLAYLIIPVYMLWGTYIVLNVIYFLVNPYKLWIYLVAQARSQKKQQIELTSGHFGFPIYTILVPLRHESAVLPDLLHALQWLDYPPERLDFKFIVDADDQETIQALQQHGIGVTKDVASIQSITQQLIIVPKGSVATKPRACNYALAFARGTYTVIFDAEDRPEPDQLRKAYATFLASSLDTICVQAELGFYNERQNLLTKLFSLEYAFWFRYYLPGLELVHSPIPLGGTSNHFITSVLRKIGTWDPYNVTEDADLGLRISRYHFRTGMCPSVTYEEANSNLGNWIRQRTRWQKGFLLTFIVHIRNPMLIIRQLGFYKFLLAVLSFGGTFFLPFFNPLLWIVFIISFTPVFQSFPKILLLRYIAVINLVLGNGTYFIVHAHTCIRTKKYYLLPASILLPFYWLLISIATYRATIQFIFNPYYWEKTKHGLNKRK